ncbi:hypothetical protein [uncultured Clostridium sp.]|uniref:hypothetical protein n=1 Tax=uncultured Clostridium sp. TaxID=59620 RepID=UPI002625AA86|nr:hypothetical protein [uncultured Clostridium sp.]
MEKRYLVTKEIMTKMLEISERQLANLVDSQVIEKHGDRYNLIPSVKKYMEFKGALRKDSSNEVINAKTLGAILGISDRTVTELALKNIVIRKSKDSYLRDESISNYIEYIKTNLDKNADGRLHELNKKKYDAELKDLKLKELKKELHRTDVVKDIIQRMIQNFKGKCLILPSKVAPALSLIEDREKIEEVLREEIYSVLKELSEWDPEKGANYD